MVLEIKMFSGLFHIIVSYAVIFIYSYLARTPFFCRATKISVGVIVPRSLDSSIFLEVCQVLEAAVMAIDEINNSSVLLPNSTLKFVVKSDNVDFVNSLVTASSLASEVFNRTGVSGVVGAYYDSSTEATDQYFSSTRVNIPQISYKASSVDLGDKLTYPNIFRTSISDANDGFAIAQLLGYFKWKNIILFASADNYGNYLSQNFFSISNSLNVIVKNIYALWAGQSDYSYIFDIVLETGGILNIFVILMNAKDTGTLIWQGYKHGIFHEGVQIIGTSKAASSETWLSMPNTVNIPSVMKGFLAVYPTVNRNNNNIQYLKFIESWNKRLPTLKILKNNHTVLCSTRKDDMGSYIYQYRTSSQVPYDCYGLDLSSKQLNYVNNIYDSALNAYDSIYAFAYTYHHLLYHTKQSINSNNIKNTLLYNISFEGASGNISFASEGIGSYNYGKGDRKNGINYKFLNFNPKYYNQSNQQIMDNGLQTIVIWDQEANIYIPCNPITDKQCVTEVIFNTIDNKPAIDYPLTYEIQLSSIDQIFIIIPSAIGLVLIIILFLLVYIFAKHKLLKAAQPEMLMLMLFGILLAFIKVIVATVPVTDSTCICGVWLGHLSFIIIFGAMIIKTWRVNKIVNSGLSKVKITITDMRRILGLFFIFFCLLLVMHTLVAKPHQSYELRVYDTYIHKLIKCDVSNVIIYL